LIENPYMPGQPLESGDLFLGRETEMRQIIERITAPSKMDIFLFGDRRIGKTTILKQLQSNPPKGYKVVLLDPQYDQIRSPKRFVSFLLRNIDKERFLALGNIKEMDPDLLSEELQDALMSYKGRIILLIDETDLFKELGGKNVLIYLRGILQRYSNLVCVVTGSRKLMKMADADDVVSPVFNAFFFIKVGALGRKEAQQLIQVVKHLTFEDAAIESILDLSGQNPYLIHSICFHTINVLNEIRSYDVSPKEVERAKDIVMEQNQHHCDWIWKTTDALDHRIMTMISSSEGPLEFSRLVKDVQHLNDGGEKIKPEDLSKNVILEHLTSLIERDILERVSPIQNKYRFRIGLMKIYINTYKHIGAD